MSENGLCWRVVSGFMAAAFLPVSGLFAADGIWTGAENAFWTNSANWSAAPYPGEGTGETAVFDGSGNGNTLVGLDGLVRIFNVSFDGASAAAYTLGTGGADVQTLTVDNSGTLAVSNSVINSQTVQASVRLGTNTAAGTYNFLNSSAESTLTFAGGVAGGATGGTAGTKTLNLNGSGRIVLDGVLANGGASSLALNSYGTNTLAGDNTFSGNIIVYDGTLRLTHSNALGTGSKTASANNNVNGRNPSFVLDGSAGNLSIPPNVTFQTSNSRAGAIINEAGDNTILGHFRLTGGDGATHLWSKGGKLTIAGNLTPSETLRQLYLRGDSDAEISGIISNGTTTTGLPVLRDVGSGTWTLSGANMYSGATTVSAGALIITGVNGSIAASASVSVSGGASFRVENTAAANLTDRVKDTAAVTLNNGTFAFVNDGGAADFSETVGTLTLSGGNNVVSTSQAAEGQTSTVTFSGLSRSGTAAVSFIGAGLGTERNRIFIAGQAEGPIGIWASVNAAPALYSSTLGVYADSQSEIGAKGDTIPSGVENVMIMAEGTTGPNELSDTVTVVGALVQNSDYASTVNTAEKTLKAGAVMIATGKADLTLGVASNDGTLVASDGGLAVVNSSGSTLTVNAVVADDGGASSLTKSGAGAVVLAGANTFSGLASILQGSLTLANPLALQNAVLGTSGAVFDSSVASGAFTVGNLTNSFALPLADNAANPVTLSVGNNNADSQFGGAVSGAGSLRKVGAGALRLTGTSTYSGGTRISGGALSTGVAGGLGTGPVTNDATLHLTTGNVTYTALGTSLSGAGTVNVTLSTGSTTTPLDGDYSAFTGVWNLGVGGTGGKARMNGADIAGATVNVLSNATVYVAQPVVKNATAVLHGGDTGESAGQLRLDGLSEWAGPVLLAGEIIGSGDGFLGAGTSATGTVSGVVSDLAAAYPVHKVGNGTVRVTGTGNTFAGPVWVRAGTLGAAKIGNVGEPGSLGQPANAADGTIKVGTGGTSARLSYLGAGETTDRVIDMAGTTGSAIIEQAGEGLLTFTGDVVNSGSGAKALVLDGDTGGVGELAGSLGNSDSGSNRLVKQGTGKWVISKANTYSGDTVITNGTLSVAHPNAIPAGSLVRLFGTAQRTAALSLDNDGVGETEPNITLGVGFSGTIASGAGESGVAADHRLNELSVSLCTVTVTRAASVLSGDPRLTIGTLNLSGGGAHTTTLAPTDADVRIGRASILQNNYAKTLRLDGTSQGNVVTGAVYNQVGTLSVYKDNTSTWTFEGPGSYSGATTVNNGTLAVAGAEGAITNTSGFTVNAAGVLRLGNAPEANHANRLADNKGVTLNGGRLDFAHTGGAADYSETVGAVTAAGAGSVISVSRADVGRTSALTLTSLARTGNGTLDFSGDGLGADARNRVLIGGHPDGLVGFWSTYNGAGLAMHDSVRGVYGSGEFSDIGIAARGPSSVIPDDASANVRITSAGESGAITLASGVTRVALLTQATGTPAVIDTASKTFQTHGLVIEEGQASLTVGAAVGDGTLTAASEGGKLSLGNVSESVLTVNAALADNVSPTAVDVSGPGQVVLNGATLYTGTTAINNGMLVFGGHTVPQAVTGVVGGNGSVVKSGTNLLHLLAANTYTGTTYISEGIVRIDKNTAFGTSAGGVVIAPGATLDVGCSPDVGGTRNNNGLSVGTEAFTVSGAGVNGMGAIINSSTGSQYSVFGRVTLAGDTTFGGTTSSGRFDIRNNTPTLTMNGYTLTKVGPNMFGLTSANVVPGAGHIDVREGTLRFESNTRMNGSSENTFTVRSGATLELYSHYPQNATLWSLICEDNANLRATQGTATSNDWAGPVTLQGTLKMWGSGSLHHTLSGPVSGPGSIIKYSTSTANMTSDANTYKGFTWITNGTMRITSIRNLGEASSLGAPETVADGTIRLGSGATSVTLTYLGTGDTSDRVLELAGTTGGATISQSGSGLLKLDGGVTATANGNKTLTLSGSTAGTGEISGPIQNPASGRVAITKNGTSTWVLSGNNTFTGDVNIAAGTLTLSGSNAQGNGRMAVGSSAGSAVLKIAPGAAITGAYPLRVGSAGGSHAAVYMEGGSVKRTTQGTSEGVVMGPVVNSYGSFTMSGGELAVHRIQTGASNSGGSTNIGLFRMTGGAVTVTNYLLLARGIGSQSAFTIEGGTLYFTNTSERISLGYEGGRAEVNLTGGSLLSTTNVTVRQSANGSTGIVNLCSGTLAINLIQNTSPGVAILNFAGGTLKAGVVNSTAFIPSNMTGVYSYGPYGGFAGGAVIDTVGPLLSKTALIVRAVLLIS